MTKRWHHRAAAQRLKIWGPLLREAQREWCPLCARRIPTRQGTIDHVTPLAKGGADSIGNWMLVHSACNNAKGDRMPTELELKKLARVNAALGLTAEAA